WAAGRTTAPLADLLAAGVTVTQDQYAYASLTGTLSLADVDVPLVQRYRLLRAWSGDDAPAVAEIVAGLTTASHSVVVGAHSPDPAGPSADPVLES
ncbi:hypothetical protein G3M53_40065, partial [Streptomyces sp. SID7982]|nr:hypothetical protein [Streptomyces sp. SID7982]